MPKVRQTEFVQLLNIHEAAQILGVSTKTLRRWEKQKLITPVRTLGNQRRYRSEQLEVILRQRTISKWLIPAGIRKLFKLSSAQKFTLAAIVTLTIISASLLVLNQLGIQYSFSLKLPQIPRISFNPFRSEFREPVVSNIPFPSGTVLAAQTTSGNLILKVNVPTLIDGTATVSGNLTAPNIVYNLLEGTGIDITGDPQTPTISTTDQTTDLKIFKTFKVGSTEISAGSKTDTFTFVAGSNITLSTSTSDKKLTIAAASTTDPGWTDAGSVIHLSTAADLVNIGSATGSAKLSIEGSGRDLVTASSSGNLVLKLNEAGLLNLAATGFSAGLKLQNSATLFSGSGVPSDSSGANGDYYFRTDGTGNSSVYTKVGGSWTPAGGASTTLQDAFDNDTNGSDAIIALTSNDESLIFRNPASSGTDSGYVLSLDQLAAGSVDALRISNTGLGTGLTLTANSGGQAAAIINKTGANGDIFTASASGAPRFTIGNSGNFTIPAQTAASSITSTQTDSNVLGITANSLTSGNGLLISSSTTGALTNGLERINASAAHTGTAWQLISGTQTGGAGSVNVTALTTGTGFDINTSNNTFTTGNLLRSYSTATSLTTGKLAYFNWEPSAVATASGDLVGINIGNAGDTTGNLFNITTSGSSLFSVSETAITSALPHSFTAAGDVSLAYDLLFTNQTASYLKSNAPFYIQAGEIFESNNLTLKSYNSGNIILDTDTSGKVLIGTGSATLKFTVSDSFAATAAAMIENQYNGTDADGLAIKLGYTGNGATSNRFISFLNGSSVTVGRIEATTGLGVAYQTTGIDFAEYFAKDGTQFEEGDIVTLKSNGATKSNTFSDPNMIGIVSASPGFKGGEEGPTKVLVGLVGQVPVKISPSSNPIQTGDLLTSSSDPGRAAKATRPGFTIAKALEPWSPNSGQDKILAFVNPAWSDPNHTLAFDENGNLLQANVTGTPAPTEVPSSPRDEVGDQTILENLKVDQSAEIGLDLRVLGQLQVEGALTVTGVTNFIGTVFFNKDTAGFAAIPTGARFVTVNYEKEYLQPPVVTVNPVWETDPSVLGAAIDQPVSLLPKQDYIIAASSNTGFTILLEQPAVIDLKFSWTALSVKDPRTISASAPAPTPSPEPTLTPTPSL